MSELLTHGRSDFAWILLNIVKLITYSIISLYFHIVYVHFTKFQKILLSHFAERSAFPGGKR